MTKIKKQLSYYLRNNMEQMDREILKGILANPEQKHHQEIKSTPFANDHTEIFGEVNESRTLEGGVK